MGKLGYCRYHCRLAMELGSCSGSSARNMRRCHWSMVLRRVRSIMRCCWLCTDFKISPVLPPPPPTSTHTIHAALTRASQPSLGTIVLSALIIASLRALGLVITALRLLPLYLPPYMRFVSVLVGMIVGYLEGATGALSTYALVYTGLTGDAFFPSAKRSRVLTLAVESSSVVNYRRRFKTDRESRFCGSRCCDLLLYCSYIDPTHCRASHTDVPLRLADLPLRRAYVGCSR